MYYSYSSKRKKSNNNNNDNYIDNIDNESTEQSRSTHYYIILQWNSKPQQPELSYANLVPQLNNWAGQNVYAKPDADSEANRSKWKYKRLAAP